MDVATPLAGARRDLSGMRPEDHHGDGVAQPPHRVANPRWQGHDREPRARASELPPADPQPRFRRGEAASREGRWKGLSCMNGNIHVQFLGEGVAVTPPPYPARMEKDALGNLKRWKNSDMSHTSPAAYPTTTGPEATPETASACRTEARKSWSQRALASACRASGWS